MTAADAAGVHPPSGAPDMRLQVRTELLGPPSRERALTRAFGRHGVVREQLFGGQQAPGSGNSCGQMSTIVPCAKVAIA